MKINLFPTEVSIEERISYLEKFVLFSILTWSLYDLIIRYSINNIYWLAALLGSLLTSISIATTNFGKITTLVFNRYQVLGRTNAGRYISIVYQRKAGGIIRVISVRDMIWQERKRYKNK